MCSHHNDQLSRLQLNATSLQSSLAISSHRHLLSTVFASLLRAARRRTTRAPGRTLLRAATPVRTHVLHAMLRALSPRISPLPYAQSVAFAITLHCVLYSVQVQYCSIVVGFFTFCYCAQFSFDVYLVLEQ